MAEQPNSVYSKFMCMSGVRMHVYRACVRSWAYLRE